MKLVWSEPETGGDFESVQAEGDKRRYVCSHMSQDDPWLACVIEREGMDSKRPLCEAVLEIAKMICQEHEDAGGEQEEEGKGS